MVVVVTGEEVHPGAVHYTPPESGHRSGSRGTLFSIVLLRSGYNASVPLLEAANIFQQGNINSVQWWAM